jgi:G3E family GTPase
LPTTYGQVDAGLLLATGARAYWRGPTAPTGNGGPHPGDGIESFSFRHPGLLLRSRFEAFLQRLPPTVYRAKGIVKFAGEGWCSVFNYTCGRARIDWLAPAEEDRFDNRAVFLGRDLRTGREGLLRRLEECVERSP